MTKEFLPIRTKTITGEAPLLFEPYVQVGTKYVKFASKGSPPELERFARIKKQGVKKLFIPTDMEDQYLAYLEGMFTKALDATDKPVEERATVLRDAAVSTAEDTISADVSERDFKLSTHVMETFTKFVTEEEMSLGSTLGLDSDRTVYQHSLNVAALAASLMQQMGEGDPVKLNLVSMAALMHDIGKTKLSFDPMLTDEEMTAEQLEEYKQHPTFGEEILAQKEFVDPKIVQICGRHEEQADGNGFPNGMKKRDLSTETQIIALCNIYDRYVTVYKLPFGDALKKMTVDKLGSFDLELFKAFQKLIKDQKMDEQTSEAPPPT